MPGVAALIAVPFPLSSPVIVVVSVRAGVAPPEELPANPLLVATETAVTVPWGCAVHPTTPEVLVVRALVPLQLAAAPTIARLVVVALVDEALVANKLVKVFSALKALNVLVLNDVPKVAEALVTVKVIGAVAASDVVAIPPPEEAVPFDAAVMRPFPSTVMLALVKEPTLAFTVARVPAAVTLPVPSKLGEVYAKSPVIAIVRPVCSAAAVPALPVIEPVMVCKKVLKSDRSVEEAAVIVPEAPSAMLVLFTVIDEFCKALLGKLRVELAATNGIPVGPVMRKPLLPRPKVVVVLKSVVRFGVVPPLEKSGLVAVTAVIDPPDVPQSPAAVEMTPALFTCKQRVPPPVKFERVRPPKVNAEVVALAGNGYPKVA